MANEFRIKNGYRSEGNSEITGSLIVTNGISGSFSGNGSGLTGISTYIDNLITVGLSGSETNYFSIKSAVDSITDATATNTYTVRVSPGVYIESEMTVPSYVAIKGDSSISTIVSASNPSSSIFIMSDQSMVIDMQIQGSTAPGAAAIIYSSPTTPQTNAIAYVENVRFGTNYTNAKVIGTGSNGNCILQCTNVKYGGFTELNKSFDVGFHVTRTGSAGIGRMQLRNVTSTNGGVTGSDNNQIFALSDAPNCAFIVNGCLLTRAAGSAIGTGFKVYNGGNLRLTGVNFQRWDKGIWAPQTGSAPSIDAIALNFENCTTDVLIAHTGSIGKVQGTDNFLKTQISHSSSLYEVGQDPRRITVGTKGADFTSISASVAYITDSSDSNRYVIEVGPGRYTEKEIDLTGKPYVSIVGSSIQTTQIFPSSSNQHLIKMGINNEISFLSLTNAPAGYSALYVDDVGDYAQAHKVSFYDCDTCLTVISRTQDTKFYGEYLDFNGAYSTGSFVSSSNGYQALASLENYYQFPVGATGLIANYGTGDVAELDFYAAGLIGESDPTSVAIRLENGADLQGLGMDLPGWGSAVYIPNLANSASFNIVGSMIHDSVNYDFEILHPSASCRFQGTADHGKINNASSNFFWTFLDENDGELDITRKLSVTFADGTHTDASTLIFEGSPMGVMSGGNITISGSLTITTAAGYGYLHNMGTEVFQRIDWANSNLTLSPNTNNYIFIDSTATLTSSPTQPDSAHNIILGRVVTNDTGIELVDNSPYFAAHMSNALSKFNRNALGPVFAEGSIVSEDVTPRQLDVTAGLYYFGENEYDPTGGSAITFTQYYQSGSGAFGWNKSSQTVVPNNVYNSGSALVAMSSSYYTKHTLYTIGRGPDEEYFLVVGQNQYATLVQAEDAGLPTPPTYFSDGVAAIASVYVQSGSANITQIEDVRPIIGFRAAGVNASSVHANLLGLNSDDHPQYLLTNGSRVLTGNLDVGGYNVVNATSISSTFTGSLQGTASWALNAITASYALNAGTTIDTGSLLTTASFNSFTGSFVTTASVSLNTITFTKGNGSTFPITVVTGSGISTFPYTGSAIISGSLLVTGSFSVLDDSGFNNINTAVRSLYASNGVITVNWSDRVLNGILGNSVVDWRNNRLISTNTTRSVDWENRTLQDNTQATTVDWQNLTLKTPTVTTVDWGNGETLWAGRLSVQWKTRKLYDSSPILSADWAARTLHDTSTTQSVDWNNRYLVDASSIQSIDWRTREAIDANQSSSINWNSRVMRDSGAPSGTGVQAGSIDWENRQTLDAYSILSSDWSQRYLADGAGSPSIYWNSRTLVDSLGSDISSWDAANQFNVVHNNNYQTTLTRNLDDFAQHSLNALSTLTQNLSGEIIKATGVLDAGVSTGNLVYLNSDGIWYKTDQTSVSSSYMLGVCVDATATAEKIFLEGNIGFTTASVADSPLVTGTNFYGVPIYISGSNGAMSTEKPTSGIVRIIGHAFYNSTTTPTNWLMKFRPSNDWYEI